MKTYAFCIFVVGGGILTDAAQGEGEWSGEIKPEFRYYMEAALTSPQSAENVASFYQQLANQGIDTSGFPSPTTPPATVPGQNQPSIAITLAYQRLLDSGARFSFKGFARYDDMDPARTHGDIRELSWARRLGDEGGAWDLRIGIDKVFWGAVESNHLIDIVNTTDAVENIDASEKLGQAMIRLTTARASGTWDFLLLPHFRAATASGPRGRLRPPTAMTEVPVRYNRALEDLFPSWVVRWSRRFGRADMGVYYFQGINRDARVTQDNDAITPTNPSGLIANYDWMRQWAADGNVLIGDFTVKGEYLIRYTPTTHFRAAVGGLEYTFAGLFGTDVDLNVVFERSIDSRGQNSAVILQNDNFFGLRFAFNDTQSTQLKFGLMRDMADGSRSLRIEGTRRMTDSVTLRLEVQLFSDIGQNNPLYIISQDSYAQLSAIYYF